MFAQITFTAASLVCNNLGDCENMEQRLVCIQGHAELAPCSTGLGSRQILSLHANNGHAAPLRNHGSGQFIACAASAVAGDNASAGATVRFIDTQNAPLDEVADEVLMFTAEKALGAYPEGSRLLVGEDKQYVLSPLGNIVEEAYTAYFEFLPPAPVSSRLVSALA